MFEVPLKIHEKDAIKRTHSFVKLSFPLALNSVQDVEELLLVNSNNQSIAANFLSLVKWQDHSLKWVEIAFFIDISASASLALKVVKKSDYIDINNDLLPASDLQLIEDKDNFIVRIDDSSYLLSKTYVGLLQQDEKQSKRFVQTSNSIALTDKDNLTFSPAIKTVKVIKQTPLELVLNYQGVWKSDSQLSPLEFNFNFSFYKNSNRIKYEFTINNPLPMLHNKGKWDLGNDNSFLFNSFICKTKAATSSTLNFKLDPNQHWQIANSSNFSIFQASSGGDNWQSKNHLNNQGELALEFSGYRLVDGEQSTIHKGRASPLVKFSADNQSITCSIDDFWQNFPKSIAVNQQSLEIGLFPQEHSDGYELQPGEKKSHTFQIDYAQQANETELYLKPLICNIDDDYLITTQALPCLLSLNAEQRMQNLINAGLDSTDNFFAKREQIDEFGWRNFGDIFADHETLETENTDELISHYNNQYDPLYGFIYQYLKTQDSRWWLLAEDLAQHIKDIDIYHTEKDKAHYNNGLFWHTDHYLSAETASHRTYSALQKSNAYQDHAGGGGSRSNHCYTSGLMLHYLLTGDTSSKKAVLQLSQWIINVFEGTGTFGEMLVALKNNNRADLKDTLSQQYPLDRGTGNYVTALLDAFELTNKQSYLDNASLVIKHTITNFDDIDQRNLLNVEESWFYTILLQSVYKYLLIKEKACQFDHSFYLIKQSFSHYCQWMIVNEYPYLDKPDILEYPNHTWTAQEIRKANILYMAFYFEDDENRRKLYKEKADFFYDYVVKTLEHEPSRTTTRILAILMQNDGVKEFVQQNKSKAPGYKLVAEKPIKASKAKQFLLNIINTLAHTSVKKELFWLRTLSSKLNCLLIRAGF